jgi:hypothetical protein
VSDQLAKLLLACHVTKVPNLAHPGSGDPSYGTSAENRAPSLRQLA